MASLRFIFQIHQQIQYPGRILHRLNLSGVVRVAKLARQFRIDGSAVHPPGLP